MTLAAQQSQFIQALMSDDAPLPEHWQARERAGYAIYRNAYRARLIDTLQETYPRTALLVGSEAFGAAAAHHLILHPPTGWTLDDAGKGFAEALENLFPQDRDVCELAWTEWAMQSAFTAADITPLDGPGMVTATQSFDDRAWQDLRLRFVPGLRFRQVHHDCRALWELLGEEPNIAAARDLAPLAESQGCVVWREGMRATFTLIGLAEMQALALMMDGASYGAACDHLVSLLGEAAALELAGAMLARWLFSGWIAAVQ